MNTEWEKRKLAVFMYSLAGVALLINAIFAANPGGFGLFPATPPAPQTPATGQNKWTETPLPTYPQIGTFIVNTSMVVDYPLEPGVRITVIPLENVAYDRYINGKFARHIPVKGQSSPTPVIDESSDYTKVGYILSPGQGFEQVRFAYVKYRGSAPPNDWFERALQTGYQPQQESYTTNIVVTKEATRIKIPVGYRIYADWGDASVDIRSENHLEWIASDEIRTQGGHLDVGVSRWIEYRVSANSESNTAIMKCTFTKLP